jgi:zinc-finger of transposase IS204/IS1001/IS1096/IS1165
VSVGIESLFTSALGLQPPWAVGEVKLDTAKRRIDFEVLCKGTRLACPQCGAAEQRIHDRLRRSWRHLDFFQFEAWLHADVPRVACTGCGKTSQIGVPCAKDRASRRCSKHLPWRCVAIFPCAKPQRCCAAPTSSYGVASSTTSPRLARWTI